MVYVDKLKDIDVFDSLDELAVCGFVLADMFLSDKPSIKGLI